MATFRLPSCCLTRLSLKWKLTNPRHATSRNLLQISCQTIGAGEDRTICHLPCGYSDRLRDHETALWHTTSFIRKVPPLPVFVKADAINGGCQIVKKLTLPVVKNVRPTLHKKLCFCNFHPTSKIWLLPNANILVEIANISCFFPVQSSFPLITKGNYHSWIF